jgi:hypothetical protein
MAEDAKNDESSEKRRSSVEKGDDVDIPKK